MSRYVVFTISILRWSILVKAKTFAYLGEISVYFKKPVKMGFMKICMPIEILTLRLWAYFAAFFVQCMSKKPRRDCISTYLGWAMHGIKKLIALSNRIYWQSMQITGIMSKTPFNFFLLAIGKYCYFLNYIYKPVWKGYFLV